MKYNLLILIIVFFVIVFSRFIPSWEETPGFEGTRMLGGIVPHHLFVRDIIGEFFNTLPSENIDNIIVLGPNHEEFGSEKIAYYPDFEDQSISAILPYIQNTFPDSKITPVLLKREISLDECIELAKQIGQIDGNNLVIASIDFSHYLTSVEAEANDKEILARIRNKDYEGLLKLSSDYIDSNAALVTSLIYFEKKGMNNIKILDNTNSGRRGNPYAPTTSYFSMIVYGKN